MNLRNLFVIVFCFTFSCVEQSEVSISESSKLIQMKIAGISDYEKNLAKASLYFGEVLKDPYALGELFSSATSNANSGSIKLNLKTLLENSEDPSFRKKSAIVAGLKNLDIKNGRIGSPLANNELIDFLKENNISVTAPYLAEDFKLDEVNELTVSWWTAEYEVENLEKDESWAGATKAVKINLNSNISVGDVFEREPFLVDDEWAMTNPTVVLGRFQENTISDNEVINDAMGSNLRANGSPVQLCDANNRSAQNILVKIPAIRLEENIAPWPKDNFIYLWVGAAGEVKMNSDNVPTITADVNMPLGGFEITRKEARIQRWLNTSIPFIISSWKPDADNMVLVWGYDKNRVDIDYTAGLKGTKNGVSAELSTKIAVRKEIKLIASLAFDKCYTLHNNLNKVNQGYGYYGNTKFPIYAFDKLRAYFTLETL